MAFDHEEEHNEINRRSDANRRRLLDLATDYHSLADRLSVLEDHFSQDGIIHSFAENMYKISIALEGIANVPPHSLTTITQENAIMPAPKELTQVDFPTIEEMNTAIRNAVTSEVAQRMTSYVLNMDQANRDLVMIKWTLYGNEIAGDVGLVRSVKGLNEKLDRVLDLSEARTNQWRGVKIALGIVGTLLSIQILPQLGQVFKALSTAIP